MDFTTALTYNTQRVVIAWYQDISLQIFCFKSFVHDYSEKLMYNFMKIVFQTNSSDDVENQSWKHGLKSFIVDLFQYIFCR